MANISPLLEEFRPDEIAERENIPAGARLQD